MSRKENTPASAEKRKTYILDQLKIKGKVRVAELSHDLGKTEVTIRSDLTQLEHHGFLERVHGGAIQSQRLYDYMTNSERMQNYAQEKINIGRSVADIVQDGDIIAVNSGTTSFYAVNELANKQNIKVVTNSIHIAMELNDMPGLEIILLGGSIHPRYAYTQGAITLSEMSKYSVNKALISIDGISAEGGLTSLEWEEAPLCRLMMERAGMSIAIGDLRKVGHVSFSRICPVEDIDLLITNEGADEEELRHLHSSGIKIIQA